MNERIKRNTPALVEQTLANYGAWDAVSFLLISHRLRQTGYESWRMGEVACLEDAVAGNSQRMVEMLEAAFRHAESMQLTTVPNRWSGWGKQSGQTLRLFHDDDLNARFLVRLSPKADRPQLDLFMDAPHTIMLNRLRLALLERDPELDALFDRALDEIANESALARLDTIRAAMITPSIENPVAWFAYLNEAIAPAVMDEFNRRTMDIMAPLWRRAAEGMRDIPFDPEHRTPHASEAWLRAYAWESCLESIESIPGWTGHAALHERRIAALSAMGNHDAVRQGWMAFCWLCPEDAAVALDRVDLHACGLHSLWQSFLRMEPAPPVEDFPAFMQLHDSHTFRQATEWPDLRSNRGWRHCQLTSDLLTHEKNGHTNVELRHSLKKASPWLFQAYMARIQLRS